MISLFIAGNLITVAQNNVSAKEKTADSNNVTRKDNQEYNFPEDIIEPGPELPMYLYPPSIEKITNTMNGIKIQWKKVENADGYRIQRQTGKDKWKDLKILNKNKYTDNAPLLKGEIGKYAGVRFMTTSNTKTVDNSGVAVHLGGIYGKDSYGVPEIGDGSTAKPSIIVKTDGGNADPLNQRNTIGWKNMFTCKRLEEKAIVRIETGVTA